MLRFICAILLCAIMSGNTVSAQMLAAQADSSQVLADLIVKSPIPVVIDFWAPWCGPCRILNPIIQDIKKEYAGKVKVMKINVDVHRQIAAYFQVSSIPAVFIVKDKVVVKFLPGLQKKDAYTAAINEVLVAKTPSVSGTVPQKDQSKDGIADAPETPGSPVQQ